MPKSQYLQLNKIRHSLAHIMATAVQELYPKVKFGIGPAIENGFYYDFGFPADFVGRRRLLRPKAEALGKGGISADDLPKIESKMKELINRGLKFEKKIVSKAQAQKLFKAQPYKKELIKDAKGKISIYQSGSFMDLCKGPHIKSSKEINANAFKLTKLAGAYWRGSEKNPMLTRIYGVAFETPKELRVYLKQLEEAEKRDHRKLGQKLDLFSFDQEVGPGLILWHPKGALLREIIRQYWIKEHLKNNYELVETPHIGRLKLWQTSGHTAFYKESMYGPMKVEKDSYQLKPMNCPFHVKIYNSQIRSYRDLPLRWAEWAQVYRFEKSGVLQGLTRVRGFTQDDAHIICTKEQFEQELNGVIEFIQKILKKFGFKNYAIYLSVRDPKDKKKFVGNDKTWNFAEATLEKVLKQNKLKYTRDIGEAKFYGPAIDIKIKDAIGREWQCSTLQLDMNLPERFKMTYIDKNGKKQVPIMLHRTLLGGICRFVALLLEHYAGALPFWLSPEQIWILPISSGHKKYAKKIASQLSRFRVKIKDDNETLGKKIREGEMQKIPYLVIVGDKEVKSKTISLRSRDKGDLGGMKIEKFLRIINDEL